MKSKMQKMLTSSIIRTMNRIEDTLENDVKNSVKNPITVTQAGNKYTDLAATKIICLERFREIKDQLENGTHPLVCGDAREREKDLIKIQNLITEYYELFDATQVLNIENLAFIEEGLFQRLNNFLNKNPDIQIAQNLQRFFDNPCSGSWGQEDARCEARLFKFVDTPEEYLQILEKTRSKDITTGFKSEESPIRMAFYRIMVSEIIEKRGLKFDWQRFLRQYGGEHYYDYYSETLKKYKDLLDIKETGMYYIYIPKVM